MSTPAIANQSSRRASWRPRWLGDSDYWIFQILVWGIFASIWITSSLIGAPADRDADYEQRQIIRNLLNAGAGIFISHLWHVLLTLLRQRWHGWKPILIITPSLLIVSTAFFTLGAAIVMLTPPYAIVGAFVTRWFQAFTIIFTWTACYLAFAYYRQYREEVLARAHLDTLLKDAELRALKSQINPHFLFNSLNSLRALMPRELEQPREAVTRLTDLLRAALNSGQQETVPLARELETVDNYLALEKIRFGSRLQARKNIAPDALDQSVPPFLIQGLVENAVKHGIARLEEGGRIAITADIQAGSLRIVITNPGRVHDDNSSTRLGLKNAQARLDLIFGPGTRLILSQAGENLVAAEVIIPKSAGIATS